MMVSAGVASKKGCLVDQRWNHLYLVEDFPTINVLALRLMSAATLFAVCGGTTDRSRPGDG